MKPALNRFIIFNLIWIAICLIAIILGDSFPIEFSSSTMRFISFGILCVGLPISIIWTANKIFSLKSKAFTIVVTIISLPTIAIALFGRSMCSTDDEVLYMNRNNSTTIVARSFGCGAWDSDSPRYNYYKKTSFLGILYLKVKVDISRLDKLVWIKQ